MLAVGMVMFGLVLCEGVSMSDRGDGGRGLEKRWGGEVEVCVVTVLVVDLEFAMGRLVKYGCDKDFCWEDGFEEDGCWWN